VPVNLVVRSDEAMTSRERLRVLRARELARPASGLDADKAFYDDLWAAKTVGVTDKAEPKSRS
jgi:hypothetical protein